MKTPSLSLHKLMRSLTKSEKRYVGLFTKFLRGESSDFTYLEILRQMDLQEQYDESALQKKIGIKSKDNFKRLKNYASEALIRSLENFHADSNPDIQILRKLIQAELLYQKKQFDFVLKSIEKAEELALERDKITYLLICIEWKIRLGYLYRPFTQKAKAIPMQSVKKLSDDYYTWMQLRRFNMLSFSMLVQDTHTSESNKKKQALQMIREVEKLEQKTAKGYTIGMEASMTLSSCYRLAGDWKNSCLSRQKMVKLVEVNKKLLPLRAGEYISVIGNLMNAYRELGEVKKVVNCFKKAFDFYKALPAKYKNESMEERYINVVNSFIIHLYHTGNYQEVIKYGELVMSDAKKHSFHFQNNLDIILFKHLTYAAFHLRQYKTSLQYYNGLLDRLPATILSYSLFGLVLYYEIGERDLLYHKARSFRYYLNKAKNKTPFFILMTKACATYLSSAAGKVQ